MSRNFELMQGIEKERALRSNVVVESPFPETAEHRDRAQQCKMAADATLGLVQRVFFETAAAPPRMVVFAGVDHGNGCSQISRSVAETLALNSPGRVCLLEANFRSPARPIVFGQTSHSGLTDALRKTGGIRSFMTPLRKESLWLLSSGAAESESPSLLATDRMRSRAAELRREFDFVIVDAPPLSRYADAASLAQLSDGVVIVLEAEFTRREAARVAVENLRAVNVKLLGAVLNKRIFPIPERIYKKL